MVQIKPREVAVAIPIEILPPSEDQPVSKSSQAQDTKLLRVWLVTSRKHDGKWVLPKGGIEADEDVRQAAIREMWEEAGLIAEPSTGSTRSISDKGNRSRYITVDDHKPHKNSPAKHPGEEGFVSRARYTAMELVIEGETKIKEDWPEKDERSRKRFTLEETEKQLEWRKDLHTIFKTWVASIPEALPSV